jgi:GntR family transcriptional repressor for pyruvate dehydrogenase complex
MDESDRGTRTGRQRKSNLLAESIAEGIMRTGLRAGDRLPTEAEMVEQYGIGRATLREALRLLEAQGVIEIRVGAGGGAFVARPQPQSLARLLSILLRMSDVSLREVLDARRLIEPELAAQAARQRDERQLAALRDCHEQLVAAPRGSEEWRRLNREFHTLLGEASHNRPLALLWTALSTIADGHEAGVRYTADSIGEAVVAHHKILKAVEAGDADAAARAMTVHLEAAADYVRRYYRHLLDEPIQVVSELGG